MKSTGNQVVFRSGEGTFRADGSEVRHVVLGGLGFQLPAGMIARYTVTTTIEDGTTIKGFKQARTSHGRRYIAGYGEQGEASVQAEILKWAARILRERKDV